MTDFTVATCPFCKGDAAHAEIGSTLMGACPHCDAVWEVETRARPSRQLCDNCAFRPGSPERADPKKWAWLLEQCIEGGEPFFCHKGMRGTFVDGKVKFHGDLCSEEPFPVCAGWHANFLAYRKQHETETEHLGTVAL